ncbi:hypothetical protein VKT23_018514 [Stygiomarasmius scandens]|uniref:F-box domain-containing protein n=1 Tax=Marasmiellus scandens TaxID=2682957 RepID=A0ABR1IP25_9AGAR
MATSFFPARGSDIDECGSPISPPSSPGFRVFYPPPRSVPSPASVKATTICSNSNSTADDHETSAWSTFVSEHPFTSDTPVSIIRLLPSEMLIEVFKWFTLGSSTTGLPAPYILGQVCRQWRALTYSTPALWQRFSLMPRQGTSTLLREFTKQWLSRSQGSANYARPIDITISDVNIKRTLITYPSSDLKPLRMPVPIARLSDWLDDVEATEDDIIPALQVNPVPEIDEILPLLLPYCESWRSLRLRFPAFSYTPTSGPLGLFQYPWLPLPHLKTLDLEYSYSPTESIQLNRHKRLVDDALVPGRITTFSRASKLKHLRLAFDRSINRECLGGKLWYLRGLELFDLPYSQLQSLKLSGVVPDHPMMLRYILAHGVELEKCSLSMGSFANYSDGDWEDLRADFDPALFDKLSFGVPTLEETDDVDFDDQPVFRSIPPPLPPTLTVIDIDVPHLGIYDGYATVAQLPKLKSLRLKIYSLGGAAQLLRGFSFPALEELSIVHMLPDRKHRPWELDPLRASIRPRERAKASEYPYGVFGRFLLRLQRVSSSFTSLHTLRLENILGVSASDILDFIEGTGDALKTIDIGYCPNVHIETLAAGLRNDNEVSMLAPALTSFRLEADLTHLPDNPNIVVDMLATRICSSSSNDVGTKMSSLDLRFFGRDWSEESRINLWKFKRFYNVRVGAKCYL